MKSSKVIKLTDVPFNHESAKALDVPKRTDDWKILLDQVAEHFSCSVESLIQHAVDVLYSGEGQRKRRKKAEFATSIYRGVRLRHSVTNSEKAKNLLSGIARFARMALSWIKSGDTLRFRAA